MLHQTTRKAPALLAMLLVAAMLLSVTGCSQSTSNDNTGTPSSASNSAGNNTGDTNSSNADSGTTLPLSDKKVTLTMYAGAMDTNLAAVASDINENKFFQELERRTNVHIDFQTVPQGSTDAFNLMIAGNKLPDLIYGAYNYAEGYDAAIEDGYHLDLTPYLDTYLKDFQKTRTRAANIERDTKTDGGRIAVVSSLYATEQPPWYGLMIRKDWLNDIGKDVPKTASEWEAVLQGFKDIEGAVSPFGMAGAIGWYGGGYNANNGFGSYSARNGKVVFNDIDQGTHDFVALLADWYKKGLIDQDFMSKTNLIFGDAAAIASGETGVFNSVYTMAGVYAGMSDDPNFEVVGVLPPAPDNGERGRIGYSMMWASSVVAISADSPNKEIAMKWLNYLFTEEGALLANFGIEGDTFEFDANGEPHYTEKMTNNPDGWNLAQCMSFYTNPPSFIPCSYAWYRELAGVPDEVIDITTYWQGQPNDYVMPAAMSLSSEENREYASLYTDISTYASERLTQFITGVANINTDWDAYVAQIKAMGIDRCVEIQQQAYDRYLNR